MRRTPLNTVPRRWQQVRKAALLLGTVSKDAANCYTSSVVCMSAFLLVTAIKRLNQTDLNLAPLQSRHSAVSFMLVSLTLIDEDCVPADGVTWPRPWPTSGNVALQDDGIAESYWLRARHLHRYNSISSSRLYVHHRNHYHHHHRHHKILQQKLSNATKHGTQRIEIKKIKNFNMKWYEDNAH